MDRNHHTRTLLLISALLVGITLAVYWPVLSARFVSYDDPLYVPLNPFVRMGLSWPGLKWAFTTNYAQNWFPLTWLSYMLDIQIFGLNPSMLHLSNLVLHLANTLLLFLLLRRLTKETWLSAFVAALFAVHPLHVESVAWIAERKDVLSGLFFLLTLLCYERYAVKSEHPANSTQPVRTADNQWVWYGGSLLMFALGLMSKPMLVTLPFILLLLDFWPLNRIRLANSDAASSGSDISPESGDGSTSSPVQPRTPGFARLIEEKLPFFILTIGSCLITMRVQTQAMIDPNALPLHARLQNAFLTYASYLKQTFWPTHLAVFYPYEGSFPILGVLAALVLLLGVSLLVLIKARRAPFALVGWFWFLGMLVPTIGVVQVGSQSRADRYTYLPLIGIFIITAWGFSLLFSRFPRVVRSSATNPLSPVRRARFWSLCIPGALAILALSIVAHRQTTYWHDGDALFRHAAAVTDENYIAWSGMGITEMRRNDYPAAIHDLNIALNFAEHHGAAGGIKYYLGWALFQSGKIEEALRALQECTPLPEQRPDRNYRLGLCLVKTGKLDEAEKAFGDAVAGLPNNSDYQFALAALYQSRGKLGKAEAVFSRILANDPKLPLAHRRLADVLLQENRPAEALTHFAAVLDLQAPDVNLLQSYADALARSGKTAEATGKLEQARQLDPKNALTDYKLAQIYSDSASIEEAISLYREALEFDPGLIGAHNDLAWILATNPDPKIRNGKEAIELANWACEKTEWKEAFFIGTLAAAYAEVGRFTEAIQTAEKARDTARAKKLEDLANHNQELLELYQQHKPYHEASVVPGSAK